ncbi:MAG: hypothetical protein ACNA8L_07335 [Luteolibacter sp.]
MRPLTIRILITLLAGLPSAPACGPFFPDTVLDLPQAALRVRATCLLDEIIEIDRTIGRGLSLRPAGVAMIRQSEGEDPHVWKLSFSEHVRKIHLDTLAPVISAGMPAELAEQMPLGKRATIAESIELAVILLEANTAPARVVEIVTAFVAWRESLPEVDMDGPWNIAAPPRADVAPPPGFPEIPIDVSAYWAAARAWRGGDPASARSGWQAILDMPESDHRNRAVWAAWMLAKTSPDEAAAMPLYQKCIALAESGHRDAHGLAALAMGWLAISETDPVARLKWYFDAACSGKVDMLISLRRQLSPILADANAMKRAAADPLAREIVTALLFSMNPRRPGNGDFPAAASWLEWLEKTTGGKPSPSAAKAAWICYSQARFDDARRWLAQAPQESGEALWLMAKLALRDGRLNEAAALFAKAAPFYQFKPGYQPPPPRAGDLHSTDHGDLRDWMRGQFHGDRAITHIGRGEFLRAMDFLVRASYHDDAAYLAERVLTADELVAWVKRNRPAPNDKNDPAFVFLDERGNPHRPLLDWAHGADPYRYLLARRLAREFRFREAAEFMPRSLAAVFNHYITLHRAARNDAWPDETKAVILWHLAVMRRHLGMEFFGYEGAPDNTGMRGNYPALDFMSMRTNPGGWRVGWSEHALVVDAPQDPGHFAIPRISPEETKRLAPHLAADESRFHYRNDAADIAWRAARLLPDNDSRMLFILHEAGRWLAIRHPREADHFYQEIIRRCPDHPLWESIDKRRWFLPEAPENPLPPLPETLRFTQPDIAMQK